MCVKRDCVVLGIGDGQNALLHQRASNHKKKLGGCSKEDQNSCLMQKN